VKSTSVFTKTRIAGIPKAIIDKHGEEKGSIIVHQAEKMLAEKYSALDDKGNKAIRFHMKKLLLPSFSCYIALQNADVPKAEAMDLIKEQLCRGTSRAVNIYKKLSNKSFAYGLLRGAFNLALPQFG